MPDYIWFALILFGPWAVASCFESCEKHELMYKCLEHHSPKECTAIND